MPEKKLRHLPVSSQAHLPGHHPHSRTTHSPPQHTPPKKMAIMKQQPLEGTTGFPMEDFSFPMTSMEDIEHAESILKDKATECVSLVS
ncbi:hypothetical protein SKAU_G00206750 [Synaphobranchus kaupii]|uniref:Uncharacterized protein n=1 Tax=Synaphobranchus kaupii TaxID=118154 RepID=A0A9Q1F811_SYNKA|nr:hypothetical protein SKAU_G00206750 [Synaphobranchus kaupii]